jgi:hypothetical protein
MFKENMGTRTAENKLYLKKEEIKIEIGITQLK